MMPVAPAFCAAWTAVLSSSPAPEENCESWMSAYVVPGTIAQSTAGTVICARTIVTSVGEALCGWMIVSVTFVPAGPRTSVAIADSDRLCAFVPLIAMSRSPDSRPAFEAGEPATTDTMTGAPPSWPRKTPMPEIVPLSASFLCS